jgi:hypothetical protein
MGIGIRGEGTGQVRRMIVEVIRLRVLGEAPSGVVEIVEEAEKLVCLSRGEELGGRGQRGRIWEEAGEVGVERREIEFLRGEGRRRHGERTKSAGWARRRRTGSREDE